MLGTLLGPYRLVSELGSGGMGTVYLARAEGGAEVEVGTELAVKVIHPHLVGRPDFVERLLREGEIGRRVRHANVVSTYGAHRLRVLDQLVLFLAMERVQGRTLRALLGDLGRIPEVLLREIGRQVASGLAAIHAAGVVHRDLKPENVLITEDHHIRIMDLGVARLLDDSHPLTEAGHFAGSLMYAAPEQFGQGGVTTSVDLYAFGAMLYELATGTQPFRREDAGSIIRAHLEEVPPPLARANPDVSPFLSEVVATLLSKNPRDRYPSASYVGDLLAEGEGSSWWAQRANLARDGALRLPRVPVPRETALHGRTEELATLVSAWEDAKGGRGNTVVLEGEAGIGKSRLLDALVNRLESEEVNVLYGSYPPSGGVGGISSSLIARFGSRGIEDALRPYLCAVPALVPSFAALLRRDPRPAGAPTLDGDVIHTLTVHLMQGLAAEKPLVWIIDDLHFASPESRRVALSMARAVEDHPILLLLTARPGLPEAELAHFSRLRNLRKMRLGRLSPREVVELLRDAFRSSALASRLGGNVAYKSDGVPFFVLEMIHGLKERHLIEERPDGSFANTQVVDELEVPSAVRDLIEGRLSLLTPDERAILDVGAVQGFAFDAELVARVLERKHIPVLQSLAEIERRSGIVRGAGPLTRFDHHQIQEVVYQTLPEPLRVAYHAALATARTRAEGLDEHDPTTVSGELAVFLATHHVRGSRAQRALPYLEAALDHLEASYRNDALIDLLRRAVQAPGLLSDEMRASLLLRAAQRLVDVGNTAAAKEALGEAARLACSHGGHRLPAAVATAQGQLLLREGRYPEAESILRDACSEARAAGDKGLEAAATEHIGMTYYLRAAYDEARTYLEQARALAQEAGDAHAEAQAEGGLGLVLRSIGLDDEARACHERHLHVARTSGDRRGEMNALGNLGNLLNYEHRDEEAHTTYERALAVAREIGHRNGEAALEGSIGGLLWKQGHLAEAQAKYETSLMLDRETGNREGEARMLLNLGGMWRNLGAFAEATALFDDALSLCRQIGARLLEGHALLGLGAVLHDLGRLDEARVRFEEARSLFTSIAQPEGVAAATLRLAGAAAEEGRPVAALELLDHAAGLYATRQQGVQRAKCDCRRAVLVPSSAPAAADAMAAIDERSSVFDRIEMRYDLWRATGSETLRREARDLVAFICSQAPESHRAEMVRRVPVYRTLCGAGPPSGAPWP